MANLAIGNKNAGRAQRAQYHVWRQKMQVRFSDVILQPDCEGVGAINSIIKYIVGWDCGYEA